MGREESREHGREHVLEDQVRNGQPDHPGKLSGLARGAEAFERLFERPAAARE